MVAQKRIIGLFILVIFLSGLPLSRVTAEVCPHSASRVFSPSSNKHKGVKKHAVHKAKHSRHPSHGNPHAHRLPPTLQGEVATPSVSSAPPSAPRSLISALGARMVQFVHSTMATLRYTAYKFGGTHFDRSKGIYIVDCSDYVDHLLQVTNPSAYLSLIISTGSGKPTSEHYYHFFTGLTYKPRHYWNKVEQVDQLQPGDILVFRNKKNSHTGVSGHVMVVMNKPTPMQDAFLIRVTDSASSGHSHDTRLPHTSGIGIGTMQIKVNPDTGQPSAYAWKLGSAFEKHVNFAMARPVGY